jgi:S1-C subfamily serine protease
MVGCGGEVVNGIRVNSVSKQIGSSTVALVRKTEDKETRSYCTGVWVSSVDILTAGHCVGALVEEDSGLSPVGEKVMYIVESEVTEVQKDPVMFHDGVVSGYDKAYDLGLIRVSGNVPDHNVSEFAEEMPGLGEQVYFVGHPRGMYWSYIVGVVAAYRREVGEEKHGPFVQVSAPVYFGNSGGGVFDRDGKLFGIASFITRSPNTGFYIHRDSIVKFLKNRVIGV